MPRREADEDTTLPSPSPAERSPLTRREFLDRALVGGAAVGTGLGLAGGSGSAEAADRPRGIRRRGSLGRTGIEIPDISFGTFSLERDEGLVQHAIDRGITHFDTAESYTEGRAEEVLGRALRGLGSRRHDITLTSKYWAKPDDSAELQMRILEKSLVRLGVETIDVYLNHAVNDVARIASPEWQRFITLAKEQGKIRAAGLSGHSGRLAECLTYALDQQIVDAILVAYNFSQQPSFASQLKQYLKDLAADFDIVTTHPRLPQILARAHREGVGVMVMKTLKGARLNDMRPYESPGRSFAQAAFRFVLADPSIDGLVVSMTSREMIDEYVEASGSGPPDKEDLALLGRYEARNAGRLCQIGCGDCLASCPASVPIADVLRMRMYDLDYGQTAVARREYARLEIDATACLGCSGAPCRDACPNGIEIGRQTRETHFRLS